MSKEERRNLEAFIYWVETNTERGVSTIPDYICNNIINLITKQQKEIENIQTNIRDTISDLEELQDNEYDGMVQDFIDTLKDLF